MSYFIPNLSTQNNSKHVDKGTGSSFFNKTTSPKSNKEEQNQRINSLIGYMLNMVK